MLIKREWQLDPSVPSEGDILERLLASRRLLTAEARRLFFAGTFDDLYDPMQLADMGKACQLLDKIRQENKRVLIHGDYDADGLTAAALMAHVLTRLGLVCETHIPNRLNDGYGLSDNSLDIVTASACALVITVDCGISSHEQIRTLREQGLAVIVTDHHECKETLPDADAVINPKRPDQTYPFSDLAGVGVACKFLQAYCAYLGQPPIWQDYMDLVALGTVADVVPMHHENRIFVRYGLKQFYHHPQPGISALLHCLNLKDKPISEQTLGYVLGPRLNAAGRLGQAELALQLLLTENRQQADRLANDLNEMNARRQIVESELVKQAVAAIEADEDWADQSILIAAGEAWPLGVLGIAAARLAEQYNRPVLVLSGDDTGYQGSGRSWDDFDLLDALRASDAYISQYGGHRKAAGLSVEKAQYEAFCRQIKKTAREMKAPEDFKTILTADMLLPGEAIQFSLAKELEKLSPYGEQNPQPVWMARDLVIESIKTAGNGRHLKLQLSLPHEVRSIEAIAFGLGDADEVFQTGDSVDLIFTLEINTWQGRQKLQLNIKDIRPAETGQIFFDQPWLADRLYRQAVDLGSIASRFNISASQLIPENKEYKAVYQFLKARFQYKAVVADLSLLARAIGRSYCIQINMFRLARILDVFEEAGLLHKRHIGQERVHLTLQKISKRVNLDDSPSYKRLQLKGI